MMIELGWGSLMNWKEDKDKYKDKDKNKDKDKVNMG